MRLRAFALAMFMACSVRGYAQELQGAAKTLKSIDDRAEQIIANRKPNESTTLAEWKILLANFRQHSATSSPEEQAKQWLQLLDQLTALNNASLKRGEGNYEYGNQFTKWLEAAPPPAAWPRFVALVEERPIPDEPQAAVAAQTVRLLAHTLANDETKRKQDQEQLEKLRDAIKDESDSTQPTINSFSAPDQIDYEFQAAFPTENRFGVRQRPHLGDTPEEIVANLEKQLNAPGEASIYIPDLANLIDAEKAEAILKKALLGDATGSFFQKLLGKEQAAIEIEIEGEETKKLAKKVLADNPKGARAPLFSLVETPEDAPLYEALVKRFGDNAPWTQRDQVMQLAANCYLAHLLNNDRLDEAKKLIEDRLANIASDPNQYGTPQVLGSDESRTVLLEESRSGKLFTIFDGLLSNDSKGFPWAEYFEVAEKSNNEEAALKHGRDLLDANKLSSSGRRELADKLYRACLSQELVDEAVQLLKDHLAVRLPDSGSTSDGQSIEDEVSFALRLSELGRLVGNSEWQREGLDLAIKLHEDSPNDEFFNRSGSREETIAKLLRDAGRTAEAEQLLSRSLARWATKVEAPESYAPQSGAALILTALAGIYDAENRHEDVLLLLEKAPWWQQEDLATNLNAEFAEVPLGLMAARALANTGRTEEAKKTLMAMIEAKPGYDLSYGALLALDPQAAVALFDKAAANDPFQERPLIWKAKYQLEQGSVKEAAATIRQAILIDPSDGEQGKERRMFAYTVLADVLEQEGDEDGAKIFRKAVAAIRQAEKADDYRAAGLEKRARALYKEALELFNDAYCVQSRLAIQLYEAGLTEEAAKHYQRAYELMPDSFGMVESHCFGCEGAFRGRLAQSLAEQVFEGLVKKHPEKPQVHYLLGYLRESQNREAEAIKHYQEAVKLAPHYLNAWSKLENLLSRQDEMSPLLDEAIQAQLRLDPLGKHGSPSVEKAHDLKTLWELLEQAAARYAAPPKQLLPLTASAAHLEQQRKEAEEKAKAQQENPDDYNEFHGPGSSYSYSHYSQQAPVKPALALARNERLANLGSLILRQR